MNIFSVMNIKRYESGIKKMLQIFESIKSKQQNLNVMITVRLDSDIDIPDWLKELNKICNLTIFVSFGSLNKETEQNNFLFRRNFLEKCFYEKIHCVPLFKPLVKEWFDFDNNKDIIKDILNYSDSIVVGGLKLTLNIVDNLILNDVPVPKHNYKNEQNYIDENFLNDFVNYVHSMKRVNVYKHRICPIYDYFGLNYNCKEDCNEREFCVSVSNLVQEVNNNESKN
jgi:hypothetical protein